MYDTQIYLFWCQWFKANCITIGVVASAVIVVITIAVCSVQHGPQLHLPRGTHQGERRTKQQYRPPDGQEGYRAVHQSTVEEHC